MTPLRTVAGISTPESTLLVVQPYDTSAIPAIERAIMQVHAPRAGMPCLCMRWAIPQHSIWIAEAARAYTVPRAAAESSSTSASASSGGSSGRPTHRG